MHNFIILYHVPLWSSSFKISKASRYSRVPVSISGAQRCRRHLSISTGFTQRPPSYLLSLEAGGIATRGPLHWTWIHTSLRSPPRAHYHYNLGLFTWRFFHDVGVDLQCFFSKFPSCFSLAIFPCFPSHSSVLSRPPSDPI